MVLEEQYKKAANNPNLRRYKIEYESIKEIKGPLIFLKNIENPMFGGILTLNTSKGDKLGAQIIDASNEIVVAQVFQGTYNLQKEHTKIIQEEDIFKIEVSDAMLGTPLNGLGIPIDSNVKISPIIRLDVTSNPINPSARDVPKSPIETGVPAIDGLNTLVKGQKLPIFTGPGLPANKLAVRIAKHVASSSVSDLIVVFGAMGITKREGDYFRSELADATGASRIAFFLNYIDDPTVERLLTPRCALTFAEYMAFTQDKDVLVILTDMLSYAESLREIATAREEIPGRRGYPGYLYTDLATILERAGRIKGKKGSITQLSIATMPNNDITHPVPDLIGYIAEGQIVLSNEMFYKNIDPPIYVLPSLSRLMNSGIGEGNTRFDHKYVANQLYAAYAEGRRLRQLTAVTGKDALSETELIYLDFATEFESYFVNSTVKSFDETLDLGWALLGLLPRSELIRIPQDVIDQFEDKLQKNYKDVSLGR
jgi:V/A-type H+/Na+-transporting ATPase subunit B